MNASHAAIVPGQAQRRLRRATLFPVQKVRLGIISNVRPRIIACSSGCSLFNVSNRRDDDRWNQVLGTGEGFQQRLLDLAQLALVLDLQPEYVLDVEDVHGPYTIRGHV